MPPTPVMASAETAGSAAATRPPRPIVASRPVACCERCGTSTPLTDDDATRLQRLVAEVCGYRAGFVHFPLFGLCPRCAT